MIDQKHSLAAQNNIPFKLDRSNNQMECQDESPTINCTKQQTKKSPNPNPIKPQFDTQQTTTHYPNSQTYTNKQLQLQPPQRQTACFNVSISGLITSIVKNKIIRLIKLKNSILSIIYKVKLQFLTTYNYTFAVMLSNLLNTQINWLFMVQLLKMPEISEFLIQTYNQEEYQIVYKFQIQLDQDTQLSDIEKLDQQMEMEDVCPLLDLLHEHYENKDIEKLISKDILHSNHAKKFHSLWENPPKKDTKQKTKFQTQITANRLFPRTQYKPLILKTKKKSRINFEDKIFELYVKYENSSNQQLIAIYEVNLILDMFLKSFTLNSDIKMMQKRFVELIQEALEKYSYLRPDFDWNPTVFFKSTNPNKD